MHALHNVGYVLQITGAFQSVSLLVPEALVIRPIRFLAHELNGRASQERPGMSMLVPGCSRARIPCLAMRIAPQELNLRTPRITVQTLFSAKLHLFAHPVHCSLDVHGAGMGIEAAAEGGAPAPRCFFADVALQNDTTRTIPRNIICFKRWQASGRQGIW